MASSKDTQHASRSLAHRPSIPSASTAAVTGTARQSHSRNNSHSILASSLNATHRVTRRKSMSNTTTSAAAVAAAIMGASDKATAMPIAGARRNTVSKNSGSRHSLAGSLPSPPASMPTHRFAALGDKMDLADSAIDDELNDASDMEEDLSQQARQRRASDGQPLVKEGRKINRVELRCKTCGKGYKHSSCLTKHLWEHTPEWSITSKLLISKHQQVQLLEAASVLMTITNTTSTTPPDSARDFVSDQESASPPASAYSDQAEDRSSADTTPPPFDGANGAAGSYRSLSKRYSNGIGFSRSYQSAPSATSILGSLPSGGVFGHQRQLSHEQRPTSSGSDVAAAMELLSTSHGSSGGARTVHLPPDAPPVPPVPARYLDQAVLTGTSFISSFPSRIPESFTRGERGRDDTKMEGSGESVTSDDDDDMQSRARSEEDDDGVFGRMEE